MNKAQVHKGRRSEAIRDVFWCQREKDFADIGDISKMCISGKEIVHKVAVNLSGAAKCTTVYIKSVQAFYHKSVIAARLFLSLHGHKIA